MITVECKPIRQVNGIIIIRKCALKNLFVNGQAMFCIKMTITFLTWIFRSFKLPDFMRLKKCALMMMKLNKAYSF